MSSWNWKCSQTFSLVSADSHLHKPVHFWKKIYSEIEFFNCWYLSNFLHYFSRIFAFLLLDFAYGSFQNLPSNFELSVKSFLWRHTSALLRTSIKHVSIQYVTQPLVCTISTMNPKRVKWEFVVLRDVDHKHGSVPRRQRLNQLINLNRVQTIDFNTNDNSEKILALLTSAFPCLRNEGNLTQR